MKNPEIDQLFDLLDKWRLLPNYQLERRADIFFALYLSQILQQSLGLSSKPKIIPEFPIKKGLISTKKYPNQSVKMDYLVICHDKVLMIELKTDITSRRPNQDTHLKEAKKANIKKLVNGILDIYDASKSKIKYRRLMKVLEEVGWLKQENGGWKNISWDMPIEIVYIQPKKTEKDNDITVIDFEEVAVIIEKNQTPVAQRFAQSLRTWKKSPNEDQKS